MNRQGGINSGRDDFPSGTTRGSPLRAPERDANDLLSQLRNAPSLQANHENNLRLSAGR
jgi:hypothetical protein